MRKSQSSSSQLARKTVEKNRRMLMKDLCSKLVSLIPDHHFNSSKNKLPIEDGLDQAAIYIKNLRERIGELKARKELAMSTNNSSTRDIMTIDDSRVTPILEIRELDSTIELILITGKNKNFMFSDVISVLEEEGATVVSSSFSIIGDRILHSIHSQATSSRVGVEISRVSEKLKELVFSNFQEPSISKP